MTTMNLDEIPYRDCLELLRFGDVGRIGIVINDAPVIMPVNYRLVEHVGHVWIAFRTRVGNLLDQDRVPVAVEIDHVDGRSHEGWSVLVRGMLQRVDADAAEFRFNFDPEPWVPDLRDRWLVVEPFAVTGRRLHTLGPAGSASALFFG